MGSKSERHQPVCMVAHDLVNKLSAIVGHCDLLIEIMGRDVEYAGRLTLIRDIAKAAAEELTEHQRKLAAETRKAG